MATLLIVDDNSDIRQQLKWGLSKTRYDIHFAKDAEEAMRLFHETKPGVVTLDLGLPPHPEDASQGFACLEAMIAANPSTKIIAVTGFDDPGIARRAIEMGAYDFFRKPVDLNDLKVMTSRAFHLYEIEKETRVRDPGVSRPEGARSSIIGECDAMHEVFAVINKVATSDAPVLICGESGTGKELVAKAIHQLSFRRKEPLVSVNCGAIPENLLESDFFGHERGAFTGATNTVKGKVEHADKGTLFLDEIGELPLSLQVKLLRFLQEMTIQRVGGHKNITVNVRVLTATNLNIKEAMRQGQFREDLYYRIGVVTIQIPPLRERGEDSVLLAQHFLERHSQSPSSKAMGFSQKAKELIRRYAWPGNVRELENKVRRAVILASGSLIAPEDLGFDGGEESEGFVLANKTLRDARSQLERQMVMQALKRFTGNIVKASQALGISRPTLYDLMRKHDIDPNMGGRS
jgi:two-component system NtrC family response regulator